MHNRDYYDDNHHDDAGITQSLITAKPDCYCHVHHHCCYFGCYYYYYYYY